MKYLSILVNKKADIRGEPSANELLKSIGEKFHGQYDAAHNAFFFPEKQIVWKVMGELEKKDYHYEHVLDEKTRKGTGVKVWFLNNKPVFRTQEYGTPQLVGNSEFSFSMAFPEDKKYLNQSY